MVADGAVVAALVADVDAVADVIGFCVSITVMLSFHSCFDYLVLPPPPHIAVVLFTSHCCCLDAVALFISYCCCLDAVALSISH